MDFSSPIFWVALLQIVWIDLLLSGDNAVVIALACRSLPEKQRRWGILLGAGAAVGLRIMFAFAVSYLLGVPLLKVLGAVLLFWIAIKLVLDDTGGEHHVASSDSLWKAVRTIAIADAVMSLDNVVAIAAAARGHAELFIFGLLLTIPLIVFGSQLILKLISRFPILIWFGAGLLGWIAGEMMVADKVVLEYLATSAPNMVETVQDPDDPIGLKPGTILHYVAAAIGAVFVLSFGWIVKSRRREATIGSH